MASHLKLAVEFNNLLFTLTWVTLIQVTDVTEGGRQGAVELAGLSGCEGQGRLVNGLFY